MSERRVDFKQMLENMRLVCMRLSFENGVWKTWYVSKSIERYGYSQQDFLDGKVTWIDILHPDDRVLAAKQAADYAMHHLDDFRLQYRIVTKQGTSIWISEYTHINRDPAGVPVSYDSMLLNTMDVGYTPGAAMEQAKRQEVLNDILLSLHDADLDHALQILLDKTGAYLGTSRALLFMDSPDHKTCRVVCEWLNHGISSVKDLDCAVTYATKMPEIYVALRNTGVLLVNAGEIPESCREEFESEGLVSSAIFAVYNKGDHYGFVCFDDCVVERTWDEDTAGFLKTIASLISTILMRRDSEALLKASQQACETVLDNINNYIYVVQPDSGEIIFANRTFRNVFGADCIGKPAHTYIPIRPSGADAPLLTCDVPDNTEVHLEKTGQWLSISAEMMQWVDGQSACLVNCYDLTAKKHYEDGIKRLAFLDYLTGLPNRYRCELDLRDAVKVLRDGGGKATLLFIDLDDFKIVNDSYGHFYGDAVLVSFAAYLTELFDRDGRVYRLGGDEFVIIVERGDGAAVKDYLGKLLERAQKPWKAKDRSFYCTLSIGVVEFPDGGDDATALLRKADIAMYQAKKMGKNSYSFYTAGLDNAAIVRSELETLLREAMQDDFSGFEVFYQPYCDARTGVVVGAEALVRLRGKNGELLLPEQFMDLAEYLGLMAPLGEHVIARAAERLNLVARSGQTDFTMTINLSTKQFRQKNVASRIGEILAKSGADLSRFYVSINEEATFGGIDRMLELCREFKKLGIRVTLDNFGSANSSFINMRALPVDLVKISPRFVKQMDDQFAEDFIKLITRLCHHTGKQVCVNGVETREQYDFCRRLDVDMVQGFFLHRPAPAERLMGVIS